MRLPIGPHIRPIESIASGSVFYLECIVSRTDRTLGITDRRTDYMIKHIIL